MTLEHSVAAVAVVHIVTAMTLNHIVATMILDTFVAFYNILTFVMPLVGLLMSWLVMMCKEHLWNFSIV
jgi:hypothetical protein